MKTRAGDIDKKIIFSSTAFILILVMTIAICGLYFYNIVKWGEYPDFGFGFRTATGTEGIGIVGEKGRKAGMQVGDHILRVNDKIYRNFTQFRAVMHRAPGEQNTYLIERDGHQFEITIPNTPMGFKTSFFKSGFLYLLGLCYILIGTLVFLMKPHQRPSWVFFLFAVIFGFFLIFLYKISKMTPFHLETFHIFAYTFAPGVIIHLASSFPAEKGFLKKYPYTQFLPYLPAIILFLSIVSAAPTIGDAPKGMLTAWMLYLLMAVLFLLGCCIHLWLTSRSEIVKLRAKMILLGIAISASLPLLDLFTSILFGVYILPGFNYYLPFFIIFPLFVGYSIIKHDLFDIDTVIKLTYGYVLTTGAVAGVYGLFVLVSNLVFGGFEFEKFPMLPLFFLLGLVFLLNPIRYRMQRFIDRVFYRLEYDYRETVQKISESMRTLAGLDEILKSMMNTAMEKLFIDSGCIMLLNREKNAYECAVAAGKTERGQGAIEKDRFDPAAAAGNSAVPMHGGQPWPEPGENETEKSNAAKFSETGDPQRSLLLSKLKLPIEDPFIQKMTARKKEVTIYDVKEDPLFDRDREACEKVFNQLGATLIVPLIYEERLIGLMSLGVTKSGRFYRREDINLLKTLTNQGAVAIENASLLEEVIEKERMEEELSIARQLQTRMLPATCPEIAGIKIAAISTPAREVGGDFFDFIEMEEGGLGLVIGDVTGKSVSGALALSASRTMFRIFAEEDLTIEEIMTRANRRTKRDMVGNTFVALLYAVYNTAHKILTLCSAGQTQPVHLSAAAGRVRLVATEGDRFPLGIMEDPQYRETRLPLMPGDKVVFYTDGIVEAMDEHGEMYGFERLLKVVQESRAMTADDLLKEIMDTIAEFVGDTEQHDDLTTIVLSVNK